MADPSERSSFLTMREAIEQQFPAAEVERAMKIQEVILKAMAVKLKS